MLDNLQLHDLINCEMLLTLEGTLDYFVPPLLYVLLFGGFFPLCHMSL